MSKSVISVNRVKLGRINYIHTHPITAQMEEDFLKEAKDLIAKEKQVKTEGTDPQEMGIDKSLFKLFQQETQESKQENRNSAKVAGNVVMAANAFQRKKKSISCVLL